MLRKRIIRVLLFFSLFCIGCSITRGPISKKIYYSPQDPKYIQELLEFGRKDFVAKHPQLPEAIKQCILSGNLKKGMTREQVRSSLGEPMLIYKSASDSIINEQWVYESAGIIDLPEFQQNKILYFDKGILKSWQE